MIGKLDRWRLCHTILDTLVYFGGIFRALAVVDLTAHDSHTVIIEWFGPIFPLIIYTLTYDVIKFIQIVRSPIISIRLADKFPNRTMEHCWIQTFAINSIPH